MTQRLTTAALLAALVAAPVAAQPPWPDRVEIRRTAYGVPHVLARDLAAMPSWRPVEGRDVDMFPQTRHVETLLLLRRGG